jgi:signal transduction histidine kinase
MNYFKILVCFFVLIIIQISIHLLHAQCFKIDSLQRQLFIIARQDTQWVKTANILAREHLQNQQESKAYWYAQQTLQISVSLKYPQGQAEALLIQADVLFKDEIRRDKDAKDLYTKALEISKTTTDKLLIAKAHKSLGDYYYRLYYQNEEYYKLTLEHYLLYAQYTKETGNKGQTAKAYYLIGTIYDHLGNENESIKYFLEAVNLRSEMDTKELDDPHLFAQAQRSYKLQMENQKNFLYAFGGGAVLLFVILILLVANIQNRRKNTRKLEAQNKEIEEKNYNIENQNQELQKQKEEIITQYEKLNQQTQQLEKAQVFISNANTQLQQMNDHLEEIVKVRTNEIYQKNDALIKANEDLDMLIYRASHDFKGPVATILGLSNLGTMLSEPESTSLEFFGKIDYTAHKMDRMLDKLHQISYLRGKEITKSWINFENVFEEIQHNLKNIIHQNNPNLTFKIDENTSLYFDEETLIIILENLVENALHFRKENIMPHIQINVQKNTYQQQDWLYILIEDNGIGISPEHLPKVYDMFFRGSELSKGNGLGLYVVKDALERLDSTIEVESQHDIFTKFHIKIPLIF